MTTAEIQQALNAAGANPQLVVDGVNGPKTKAAVRAYQQANGLTVDGIAGPITQAKLQGGGAAAAPGAPAKSEQQTFQEKYPMFAWAFNDPEVADILHRAVDGKWGADEVQGAIQGTNWWKTKSDAERSWLQVAGTNPGEAARRLQVIDSADKYMSLSADYGLPVDWMTAVNQVQRVVRGEIPAEQLNGELRNQAKALYPQLSLQIDSGATVADIYAPYKQIASQILGVNPAEINLSDPKWQLPLQVSGKDGQKRLATTDEWQTMLKANPNFGYDKSANGRQTAAQFATDLGKMFGAFA